MGRAAELLVAADLMQRGFYVYLALPPDAPFDLAAWKDGQFYAVEVKTGHLESRSRLVFPALPERQRNAATHIAVVIPGGEIMYRPEL